MGSWCRELKKRLVPGVNQLHGAGVAHDAHFLLSTVIVRLAKSRDTHMYP